MVAVKNCLGFASNSYGGMLGLGLNANFDPNNLFVYQLDGSGIIDNATFGIQLNQLPLPSYLTLGLINQTASSNLNWFDVYDINSEMWLWPVESLGVNGTSVSLNATYVSFDSQTKFIHMTRRDFNNLNSTYA